MRLATTGRSPDEDRRRARPQLTQMREQGAIAASKEIRKSELGRRTDGERDLLQTHPLNMALARYNFLI